MISRLSGILIITTPPQLVIDVQGVGYEVAASMNTFAKLPALGETLALHTHLVVREDAHLLYGFMDQAERELFRILIRINGVGPKLALAILSSMTWEQFVLAVQQHDSAALVNIPGIGKKTAERLLVELGDKVQSLVPHHGITSTVTSSTKHCRNTVAIEAQSALVALGYKAAQAEKAVRLVIEDGLDTVHVIRLALKSLA